MRAIAKFLRQAGLTLSQTYVESALIKNPAIAVLLVRLFRHAPRSRSFQRASSIRVAAADEIREQIDAALNDVPNADDDRIVQAMLAVINAMLRTSFFQPDAEGRPRRYVAFKLESKRLELLPEPKPLYEIFVYSPDVEGVHLRFGKIARGGIRWSDRAEDFRHRSSCGLPKPSK